MLNIISFISVSTYYHFFFNEEFIEDDITCTKSEF